MRTDITFHSGDDWCAGWLYRPEGFEGPRPLMVMAHGLSATKELRLPAYAERFCAAGIGVLLFDYRHFGASGGEPRQLLDISRQHADFRRALAYARPRLGRSGARRPVRQLVRRRPRARRRGGRRAGRGDRLAVPVYRWPRDPPRARAEGDHAGHCRRAARSAHRAATRCAVLHPRRGTARQPRRDDHRRLAVWHGHDGRSPGGAGLREICSTACETSFAIERRKTRSSWTPVPLAISSYQQKPRSVSSGPTCRGPCQLPGWPEAPVAPSSPGVPG